MATSEDEFVNIRIQQIGQRLYLIGNTYAIKDALRAAGCHWDSERSQWWIGAKKRAAIESLLTNSLPIPRDVAADRLKHDRENILGRAEFDNQTYYLVGEGKNDRGAWVRLMFRDGSKTFFKPAPEVQIAKKYQKPQTLEGLREYAERRRREKETGICECWCHRRHDCTCGQGFCSFHHDGCDSCGCEN